MSSQQPTSKVNYTAGVIQRLASANNVAIAVSPHDLFAHHVTRLSGDDVTFDPIEKTIVALQRAGVLDRVQAVRLQARYLRESRP